MNALEQDPNLSSSSNAPTTSTGVRPTAAQIVAARAALIRRRIRADQNGVLIAAAIMAGIGLAALYYIVTSMKPLALYRWLAFISLYIAVTGIVLPLIWVVNRRFSRQVSGGTLLREGMWFGLFAVMVAWMRMIRALTPAIAFFIGLSMVAIEVFLRLRERHNAS